MKRRFFMLALAGLVGFSFVGTSCGDDDDDDTTTPVVKPDDQKKDEEKKDEEKKDEEKKPEEQTETKKNHVLVVETKDMTSAPWDSQFWLVSNTVFKDGDTWEVSMKIKCDVAIIGTINKNDKGEDQAELKGIGTQLHAEPGDYAHWNAFGAIPFTTEWTEFTASGTFSIPESVTKECKSIAFNLNEFNPANKYYFDDIVFKVGGTEVISNGKFEKDDFSSFVYKTAGENLGADGGAGIVAPTSANLVETDEIVIKAAETPAE
jgi:hypothetical protein